MLLNFSNGKIQEISLNLYSSVGVRDGISISLTTDVGSTFPPRNLSITTRRDNANLRRILDQCQWATSSNLEGMQGHIEVIVV